MHLKLQYHPYDLAGVFSIINKKNTQVGEIDYLESFGLKMYLFVSEKQTWVGHMDVLQMLACQILIQDSSPTRKEL